MKQHSTLAIIALLTLSSSLAASEASPIPDKGQYKIDPNHSSISFQVNHLGYADISGRFNTFEGQIKVGKKNTVELSIDSKSIDTNHDKRDTHLRSPDFFNAKQFPEISFSSMLKKSDKNLQGTLTILGKQKTIALQLAKGKEGLDPWGMHRVGYTVTGSFKRSDFGMNFMQGGIGDDVNVNIQIEAIKQ